MTWQDQGQWAAEGYYIEEEDENPEEFDIAMMRGFCTLLNSQSPQISRLGQGAAAEAWAAYCRGIMNIVRSWEGYTLSPHSVIQAK